MNGHPAELRPLATVLQQIDLPAGHSEIRFDFVPPYMQIGWACALLGALGLGFQLLALRRQQRTGVS